MSKRATKKKRLLFPLLLFFLLIVLAGAIGAFSYYKYIDSLALSRYNIPKDDELLESDLEYLSARDYDSVLLSMHSTAAFRERDFNHYCGQYTAIAKHAILTTAEFSQYFECIFNSGNSLSNIYLCIDPERFWIEAGEDFEILSPLLSEGLYKYISTYPDVQFQILLPYPHLDYWMSLDETEFETLLSVYSTLVNELYAIGNTTIYFPGFEHWILFNPDNYTETLFDVNEDIGLKLFLYIFCDRAYQITPINEGFFWDSLRETVAAEKAAPTQYPDLTDWDIVFFGDSVIGNYQGSYSQLGQIAGLSGAATYNHAVGGLAATGFPDILNNYFETAHTYEREHLCFVINFGFNDFFSGNPVANPDNPYDTGTFAGSMRTCIKRLQESYPDASYIIVSPTHTQAFGNGLDAQGELGSPLADYVIASEQIAKEMGIFYLDNYNSDIITSENLDDYLADGVHPGEYGHLALAKIFLNFMDTKVVPALE